MSIREFSDYELNKASVPILEPLVNESQHVEKLAQIAILCAVAIIGTCT